MIELLFVVGWNLGFVLDYGKWSNQFGRGVYLNFGLGVVRFDVTVEFPRLSFPASKDDE